MKVYDAKRLLDWRIVTVVVSILAVLWLQAPRLRDEFRVDEDFRTFYWMNKFYDSTLYPNDHFQRYTEIRLLGNDVTLFFRSVGYGLLFYGASFLVTPILFSKLLPFFVMPLTTWYFFEFGQTVRNRHTGALLALGFIFLNLASSTAFSVISGLQRSFASLFIIALVYYLQRRNYLAAAVVVFLSSTIYAPMFVLGSAIWALFGLNRRWPSLKVVFKQSGFGPLLIAALLGVLALSPEVIPRFSDSLAPEPAPADEQTFESTENSDKPLWEDETYQSGGRRSLFGRFPFFGRGGIVHHDLDGLHLSILIALSGFIYLVRGRRALDLPYVVWCILWASLLTFVLAWLALGLTNSFLLYLPSRYTQVGLFLFFLMFVLMNGNDFIHETLQLFQRHHKRLVWLIVGVEVVVLGLVLLYPSDYAMFRGFNVKWLLAPAGLIFGVLGIAVVRKPTFSIPDLSILGRSHAGRVLIATAMILCLLGWFVYAPGVSEASFLNPEPAERELLQFLETLPKDILLGGTPCALDSVPLFSKRQILFSCEQVTQAQLMREALAAHYAEDPEILNEFCQAQGIDYMVVDSRFFSEAFLAKGWIFFEPYNRELLPKLTNQDKFALVQVPDEAKLFRSESYFVISCSHFTLL